METKPYKTFRFWAVVVLTAAGLTAVSGAIPMDGYVDEVIGWLVTFLTSLGYRGWVPSKDEQPAPQDPPAEG